MKHEKKFLNRCGLAVLGLTLVGCTIDKDYDFSKKIDQTTQFNIEGISVKLGNTEKIFLKDIIAEHKNNSLKEYNNLYYIASEGSSTLSGKIPAIAPFSMESISILNGKYNLTPQPVNHTISLTVDAASFPLNIDIPNIPASVKELHRINLTNTTVSFVYRLGNDNLRNPGPNNEIILKFPSFVKSSQLDANNQIRIELNVINGGSLPIKIDAIEIPSEKRTISGGNLQFSGNIEVSATTLNWELPANRGGEMYRQLGLHFPSITPKEVVGVIDYAFPTTDSNIAVDAGQVPDFLKDATISITNPTLKAVFENNPLPLVFSGTIGSQKSSNVIGTANIPTTLLAKQATNTLYISPTDKPFDIVDYPAGSQKIKVENFNTLVSKLPDNVKVSLNAGTNSSVTQTLELGKTYETKLNYTVFVPFEFNKDFSLTYSDTTNSLNLEKYDASNLQATITLSAENTIPMNLTLKAVPLDKSGNVINSVEITNGVIKAGSLASATTSPLTLQLKQKAGASVANLDKIRFEIVSNASEAGGALISTQYIKLNDIRIKVKGSVIRNLN